MPLNIHNLLSDSFLWYMARFADTGVASHAVAPRDGAGPELIVQYDPESTAPPQAIGETVGASSWQEMNKMYRGAAKDWLLSKPQVRVLCLTATSEPVRSLMSQELEIAGGMRDMRENGKASCASELPSLLVGRSWPLLQCVQGVHEQACLHRLARLQESLAVDCLPVADMTVETQSAFCQMITWLGCCVHGMLLERFIRFPFKLFVLLVDPSCAPMLASACESSLGPYTKGFLAKYPNLTCEAATLE